MGPIDDDADARGSSPLHDPAFLERLLAGEIMPEALATLGPEQAATARAILTRLRGDAIPAGGVASILGRLPELRASLRASEVARRQPAQWVSRGKGVGGRARSRWVAIAAALVVAIGLGLAFGVTRQRAGGVAMAGREYATAAGQRLSVTLVDGTQFTLAPASRVRVAADYGRSAHARDVELEGEAYFAVVHNVARPFTVQTRGAVARDVGTTFDVRAYPEDAGARVAVVEGAVAVAVPAGSGCRVRAGARPASTAARANTAGGEGGPCTVEATAGDVATVGPGGVAVEHKVAVASVTGWTRGVIRFDNTRLAEILPALSRWYAVDLRLADTALGEQRVSVSFHNESTAQMLDAIALLVRARHTHVAGHVVTFYPIEGAQ